ncbi:TPA: hypothetical protein N6L14_004597 [Escherichia coli]|nr:hypothetical protein [Escherichia coli]EFA4458323.1 hypothetical protein [Escherichia coli O153]EEU9148100.1 hypothetical protein [Escherichia coli]EFB2600966.1 hypothetical protein [Escherichia coli]EFD1735963.1 hypothetical protein [Escherichia coli]EFH6188372.1 hypothetical protein [Escherichia coli]
MRKMLPGIVCDFEHAPLHVAVAMWGLREKVLLTEICVARAFGISQAEAHDILLFITRDAREFIDSEVLNLIDAHRQKIRAIRILSVSPGVTSVPASGIRYRQPAPQPATPKSCSVQEEDTLTALRRWMCSRRAGEMPPEQSEKNELLSD